MLKIIELSKYRARINTLEEQNKELEEIIKNDLVKELFKKINEPYRIEKLKKENSRLRKKVKDLKKEMK